MKLKLQSIIATIIMLAISISGVYGQANLTFSGESGSPLSIKLLQSVSYTINNSQCVANGGPIFVFNETGNPFATVVQPVTGTMAFFVNNGAGQPITSTRSGVNIGTGITTNDIYVFGNQPNVSSGQTVVLSAATITTDANIAAAPPTSGSFTTFIVSGSGAQCSTNGVALAATAAPVFISGRVLTNNGRGLSNALVYLTDQEGSSLMVRTNAFGHYRFEDVQAGQSATITVVSKRYQFAPKVVGLNEAVTQLDFVAEQ